MFEDYKEELQRVIDEPIMDGEWVDGIAKYREIEEREWEHDKTRKACAQDNNADMRIVIVLR